MKRLLFFVAFVQFVIGVLNAARTNEISPVELTAEIIHNSSTNKPIKRSPSSTITIYVEERLLFFDTSFEGFNIELLQDDEVVYSDIIDENGEVQLPDYLVGEYELRFYVGSFVFVGEIEL